MSLKAIKNPVYTRLSEQVKIENNVSQIREDILDQCFSLTCHFLFEENLILEQLSVIEEKLQKRELDFNNILAHAVVLRIKNRLNLKSEKSLINEITDLLLNLTDSSIYPLGKKSLLLYYLSESNISHKAFSYLDNYLQKAASRAIEDKNYVLLIDVLFGINNPQDVLKQEEFEEILSKVASSLPKEKLAKGLLVLEKFGKRDNGYLVELLEKNITEEFENWIEPDLWLAVIESEKLVNSNLSLDSVKQIFENLKKSGVKWSNKIDAIEKDGVFLNLSGIIRSPNFAPFEDSLSLVALKRLGRERTFQIPEEDALEFDKFKKNVIDGVFDYKSVAIFSIFLSLTLTIISSIFFWNIEGIEKAIDSSVNVDLRLKSISNIYNLLTSPLIVIGILFWWLVAIIIIFFREKKISILSIIIRFPIVHIIYKGLSSLWKKKE